jgi:hypothetical protein
LTEIETSTPPEAPFSVTWTPGKVPLITFRPEGDVTDWSPSLMEFRESGIADEIAKTQQSIDAAFLVVTQLGGQRIDTPAAGGGNNGWPAPPPASTGDGRSCPHGTMLYAEGISKKTNNPYKRYDCPQKAQGCATQWGR